MTLLSFNLKKVTSHIVHPKSSSRESFQLIDIELESSNSRHDISCLIVEHRGAEDFRMSRWMVETSEKQLEDLKVAADHQ